jgi:WD40 repeat protein
MIATCSNDRTISIWDADDGKCLLGPVDCDAGAVFSIAFSPNGKILISGKTELRLTFSGNLRVISGNDDTTVRSWTLGAHISDKLCPLSIYSGHTSPVTTVSYAYSGERIISGSEDAEIAVWEGGDSNKLVWKFREHDGPILSISVFGEEIFSSSEDKTIRVWALDTGAHRIVIPGHTTPINSIMLSPDGQWVVSASDDGRLRIWDARTGEPRRLPQTMSRSQILSVAVSHDSKQIVCGGADGQVHVWRPDMDRRVVWPDSFMRMAHGQEYCSLDDQGILANATLRRDGWLYGSTGEAMCWIPPDHRPGLLQRVVGVLGAPETALDVRKFVHGADWERCATH